MNIYENLENLNISEECLNDILDIIEKYLDEKMTDNDNYIETARKVLPKRAKEWNKKFEQLKKKGQKDAIVKGYNKDPDYTGFDPAHQFDNMNPNDLGPAHTFNYGGPDTPNGVKTPSQGVENAYKRFTRAENRYVAARNVANKKKSGETEPYWNQKKNN